jgi:serine/threonine protein kinase
MEGKTLMLKERWSEIERLYFSASELEPAERVAYLERMCGSDLDLRREVESLLEFLEPVQSQVPDTPVPSGEQIGPYTILEFLRAGGMGEVYKARDTRLDRNVAIKFLPSILADDAAALDRFRREARAASALNHPRICTVHDIGDYRGRPFFVMELLEGQSLNERMSGKPVPVSELVNLAVQTCDALQAAHAKGIIHRDMKPANIFLSMNGQIKVLDFGLAKLVEESHSTATTASMTEMGIVASAVTRTRPGRLMGTPAYLSPEQARGEEVDARTDIFSFGLVLYEMATGRPTFRGQTSGELINAILHETPAKPSVLNPEVPVGLERIILKTLEKERKTRYQSAEELLTDLREFQTAKQRRAAWRARLVVAAAALALTTGIVMAIILSKGSVNDAPNIVQRQVTSNPVNDSVYFAAISDDGKEVAYTDLRGVHIRALDTGEVYDISVPPGLCFR